MNKTLTALMSLALMSTTESAAYTVGAPFSGTVTAATTTSTGALHYAVDLSSDQPCGFWGVETGVKASLSWTVVIRTTSHVCTGTANQNEAKHTFSNGYTFRIMNFLYVAGLSNDKTCDRCQLGDQNTSTNTAFHHLHMQYDKSGTLSGAWYPGTTRGEYLDSGEVIGSVG